MVRKNCIIKISGYFSNLEANVFTNRFFSVIRNVNSKIYMKMCITNTYFYDWLGEHCELPRLIIIINDKNPLSGKKNMRIDIF